MGGGLERTDEPCCRRSLPFHLLEMGKDSYLYHTNMNQKSSNKSLLTWSAKQIEERSDAFQLVHRTLENAGMGIREKGQEGMHIED